VPQTRPYSFAATRFLATDAANHQLIDYQKLNPSCGWGTGGMSIGASNQYYSSCKRDMERIALKLVVYVIF
jgi:hypothetical protein